MKAVCEMQVIELQVKEWGCGGGSAGPSGTDAAHENAKRHLLGSYQCGGFIS